MLESSIDYDTSGWAWTSAGASNPQVDVTATLTVGSSASSKTVTLPVHPRPLILVHGLYTSFVTWHAYLGDDGFPRSVHPGWRAYAVGDGQAPGVMNTDPLDGNSLSVRDNAKQVRLYVDGVRDKTNAAHVDLVAHSLGGLISRRYIHSEMPVSTDGSPVVSHLVMMGVPNLGSVCGDILNTALVRAGRPTPVPEDLIRLAAPEFNREVVPPADIPFSGLVGNSDRLTCGVPGIGDAYVEVPSARWTLSDTETLNMKHVEMTSSVRAFKFAKDRVDESPGNQIDALAARATATAATKKCPASALKPVQLKASAFKRLKAHRTTKIAIPVAKAKRLNVVVTAPFSVRAVLRDAKGKVRTRSPESAEAGGGVRTLSVVRPRAGTWRLELVQTAGGATPAAVATLLTGSKERLAVKAKRGKGKTLVVTARAKRGKRTLRRIRVTGRLSVAEAKTRKLKLLDAGRRGDRKARDGVYTARVRRAPPGALVVAVDAKGKGFSSTSVASVCGR